MTTASVARWFESRASVTPTRPALATGSVVLTYQELHERTRRLSGYLGSLGVGPGDRVAYLGDNHPALIELLIAANRVGAMVAPLSSRLAAGEVRNIIQDCEPALFVVGAPYSELAQQARAEGSSGPLVLVGDGDGGDVTPYETAVETGEPGPATDQNPAAVTLLVYTSGTTGSPKGVLITNENLWWSLQNEVASGALGLGEQTLAVAPLFHMAGLNVTVLPTLFLGGTVHIMRRFDAKVVIDRIAEAQITSAFMVPTMLEACASEPAFADADLSSLRMLQSGGASLPERVVSAWAARGITIQQGYGMTEASPSALLLEPEDAARKPGSAGRPRLFTNVTVVDVDGTPLPPGQEGELLIRGRNVSPGYWRRPVDRARANFELRTNDIGRVDQEGFLYVLGRADEMFISGGENVYPDDVEAVLRMAPGVAECAVFGVPDPRWGSVGRALIVPKDDARDIDLEAVRSFMRANIAAFKVPATFELVADLPRTSTGKVQRRKLAMQHG